MLTIRLIRLALVSALGSAAALPGQSLDLTVNDVGIAIGNKPRVTGLRINFRDRNLRKVNGVNITIWTPYEPIAGVVNGLALGLPATGANDVNGALIGLLGGAGDDEIQLRQ